MSEPLGLEALVAAVDPAVPAGPRQAALVQRLMAIDYPSDRAGKIARLDERIAALSRLGTEVESRILGHPGLAGGPAPAAPPPAVAREVQVWAAVRSALDKLAATRAALARHA